MPPKITDQEALIPNTINTKNSSYGVYFHVGLRIFSIITFFFLPNLNEMFQFIVFGIVILIQFWFTEQVLGMEIIGLRWFIDFSSMKFSYFSKPDPFVPNSSDANAFWMIFIVNLIGWIIAFFVEFFLSSWQKASLCILYIVVEGLNLMCFIRAHGMAKIQTERNVLSAINTEPVPQFAMADSGANSSTSNSDIDTDDIDSSQQVDVDNQNDIEAQNNQIENNENENQKNKEENDDEEPFDPQLPPKQE